MNSPTPSPKQSADYLRANAEKLASGLPPLLLEASQVAGTVLAGVHGRRRAGAGETFWQFRPFVQGDTSSMIDWRQSARATDRLYVREREWEIAASAWLWCDPSNRLDYAASPAHHTKRQRSQMLATALCMVLADAGERIGLAQKNGQNQLFMGRHAAEKFAQTLLHQKAEDNALPPILPEGPPRPFVMLSDFFLPLNILEKRLKALASARLQGHLVQIIDPSEEDFPFQGRTEFLPTQNSAKAVLFGDAASVAQDYRTLFQAHRAHLKDLCAHFGWTLHLHRTDQPGETTLIALYQALAQERTA